MSCAPLQRGFRARIDDALKRTLQVLVVYTQPQLMLSITPPPMMSMFSRVGL
jgi:hypothetical protein